MKRILIETDVFSEDEKDPLNGVKIASKYFDVTAVSSMLDVIGKPVQAWQDLIFYRGSFSVGAALRGLSCTDNTFLYNCLNWVPPLKKYYVNADYLFKDFESFTISKLSYELFPVFIRPCKGTKIFSGQVFLSHDHFLTEFNYCVNNLNISPYEICLFSSVKEVVDEYRCIFVDNKYITGCLYLHSGDRVNGECPKAAIDLAIEISKNEIIPENCVIDICRLSNGEYFLLEINSVNTSSYYSCDLDAIYKSLAIYFDK